MKRSYWFLMPHDCDHQCGFTNEGHGSEAKWSKEGQYSKVFTYNGLGLVDAVKHQDIGKPSKGRPLFIDFCLIGTIFVYIDANCVKHCAIYLSLPLYLLISWFRELERC